MKKRNMVRKSNKPQIVQEVGRRDKGKGIVVDEDGFQHVHHKSRGARCNIFGNADIQHNGGKGEPSHLGRPVKATCNIHGPNNLSETRSEQAMTTGLVTPGTSAPKQSKVVGRAGSLKNGTMNK